MDWERIIEIIPKVFKDKAIVALLIIFVGLIVLIPLVNPNIHIIIIGLIIVVIIAILIRIILPDDLPIALMVTGWIFIIVAFCFWLQPLSSWKKAMPLSVFGIVTLGLGFLLQPQPRFTTKGTFAGFPKKDEYEKEGKKELLRLLGEEASVQE